MGRDPFQTASSARSCLSTEIPVTSGQTNGSQRGRPPFGYQEGGTEWTVLNVVDGPHAVEREHDPRPDTIFGDERAGIGES